MLGTCRNYRSAVRDETKCGFLLLTPTGGRIVGFLIEVAFRPTNFLPREVGFLVEVRLELGGSYG